MPFPTAFPQAALGELLSYLGGHAPELPLKQAIEDAYDLLGFALSLGLPDSLPDGPRRMGLPMACPAEPAERLRLLHEAAAAPAAIDWQALLPLLLAIIKQLLAGR